MENKNGLLMFENSAVDYIEQSFCSRLLPRYKKDRKKIRILPSNCIYFNQFIWFGQ